MLGYVVQRLILVVGVLIAVSVLVFAITSILPGNVAYLILGPFENVHTLAAFPVPLARDPALAGAALHVQGGTLDAGANALGVATSNGISIAIG